MHLIQKRIHKVQSVGQFQRKNAFRKEKQNNEKLARYQRMKIKAKHKSVSKSVSLLPPLTCPGPHRQEAAAEASRPGEDPQDADREDGACSEGV